MIRAVRQPYHLVNIRPWPLTSSLGALFLTRGLVLWFSRRDSSLLGVGLLSVGLSMLQWWRDVIREGTLQGAHTKRVQLGLRAGMLLFIVSEVMFFFSFFWAYFHSRLSPRWELGRVWPPVRVTPFDPLQIPLLNTTILLASGVRVTWAHFSLLRDNHREALYRLLVTVGLGVYFSALQGLEYFEATFTVADSVYGSTFFIATGFHGLHVVIGTTFLMVCRVRAYYAHFSPQHHFGFEAAAWYWHFVDVVWLFLFLSVYW